MPHKESDFTRVPARVRTQPRFWNQFVDAFLNTATLAEVAVAIIDASTPALLARLAVLEGRLTALEVLP